MENGPVRTLVLLISAIVACFVAVVLGPLFVENTRADLRGRRVTRDMNRLIAQRLQLGSSLDQTLDLLHSPTVSSLLALHDLKDITVNTEFHEHPKYYEGSGPQTYPEGRMLDTYAWTHGEYPHTQRLDIDFFFNRQDNLIDYRVDWFIPK